MHPTLCIHLPSLAHNYRILSAQASRSKIAAVVKANAYGLGVREVASTLFSEGCRDFCVATLDEGIELAAILDGSARIFVFHGVQHGDDDAFIRAQLIPVLNHAEQLERWRRAAHSRGHTLAAALHVDTGMNRLGFPVSEALALAEQRDAFSGLDLKLLMSHLACADQPSHALNALQYERFESLRRAFPSLPLSLANSYGIFLDARFHYNFVRPGMALYGLNPTPSLSNPMQNVVTLTAPILQVRSIDTLSPVGYGAAALLPGGARVAVVCAGYADGYLRSLGNRGYAFLSSMRVPIVGRVSMDMILLDVSLVPESLCVPGTPVELIGPHLSADDVANDAGTIGYELFTRLGPRLRRIYS